MDHRARHRLNKKLIEAVGGRSLSWRMVAKGREHVIMVDMVLGVVILTVWEAASSQTVVAVLH